MAKQNNIWKYYDDWMMSILRDEFAQQIGEDIK